MPSEHDYRGDKSESTEGRGIAVERWGGFHYSLPEEVVAEAFSDLGRSIDDLDPEIRDDIASDAVERSELIGFWVAWHLAGGFANLERGGWHRATIYRKVGRFRAAFGVHPDEFAFPWVDLDLRTAWTEQINQRLELARSGGVAG